MSYSCTRRRNVVYRAPVLDTRGINDFVAAGSDSSGVHVVKYGEKENKHNHESLRRRIRY